MKILDPNADHEYILKRERGSENPTVFLCRFQHYRDRAKFFDTLKTGGAEGTALNAGTRERNVLRAGLVGWRNLLDSEGHDVPFKTDPSRKENGRECVSEDSLNLLPGNVLTEIANFITERSTLDEDERKNS